MSKVYDYTVEMDELAQDNEWQEHQEQMEMLAQEEAFGEHSEDTKAKKFVKLLLEAS